MYVSADMLARVCCWLYAPSMSYIAHIGNKLRYMRHALLMRFVGYISRLVTLCADQPFTTVDICASSTCDCTCHRPHRHMSKSVTCSQSEAVNCY